MRIIAGTLRGRKLMPPAGDRVTRPVTDRAKQSIFDTLTPFLPDAVVYDVFSGTGSFGLEAVSRGARHATFFDADREVLRRLRHNIDAFGVAGHATIVCGDVFRRLPIHPPPSGGIDLAFFDPPYRFVTERPGDIAACLGDLATRHLAPDGLVVFRHDATDEGDTASLPPSLHPSDVRRIGSMRVMFLRRRVARTPETPS